MASDPGPFVYLLLAPYVLGALILVWGLVRLIGKKTWGWRICLAGLVLLAVAEYEVDFFLLRSRLFGN